MQDKDDVQPEQEYICSITPTEFEKYCGEILLGYAEKERLHDFRITHDTKLESYDGVYQIDLYATFTAMGVEFKVICECKQYKNSVNREKVVVLADKVKSLGAHKGILLSTSGFQRGAIQYAKQHGIALIQVFDKDCDLYSYSNGESIYDEDDPFIYGVRKMPPYKAINCTADTMASKAVYPTQSMLKKIYQEMNRLIKEKIGIEVDFSESEESVD